MQVYKMYNIVIFIDVLNAKIIPLMIILKLLYFYYSLLLYVIVLRNYNYLFVK